MSQFVKWIMAASLCWMTAAHADMTCAGSDPPGNSVTIDSGYCGYLGTSTTIIDPGAGYATLDRRIPGDNENYYKRGVSDFSIPTTYYDLNGYDASSNLKIQLITFTMISAGTIEWAYEDDFLNNEKYNGKNLALSLSFFISEENEGMIKDQFIFEFDRTKGSGIIQYEGTGLLAGRLYLTPVREMPGENSAVPVPGSLPLAALGLGLLGMGASRRRQQARQAR
jgi:hypothetical protein